MKKAFVSAVVGWLTIVGCTSSPASEPTASSISTTMVTRPTTGAESIGLMINAAGVTLGCDAAARLLTPAGPQTPHVQGVAGLTGDTGGGVQVTVSGRKFRLGKAFLTLTPAAAPETILTVLGPEDGLLITREWRSGETVHVHPLPGRCLTAPARSFDSPTARRMESRPVIPVVCCSPNLAA